MVTTKLIFKGIWFGAIVDFVVQSTTGDKNNSACYNFIKTSQEKIWLVWNWPESPPIQWYPKSKKYMPDFVTRTDQVNQEYWDTLSLLRLLR